MQLFKSVFVLTTLIVATLAVPAVSEVDDLLASSPKCLNVKPLIQTKFIKQGCDRAKSKGNMTAEECAKAGDKTSYYCELGANPRCINGKNAAKEKLIGGECFSAS